MNSTNRLTKLDIASWGGFMMFATSAIIIAVTLPEISETFSTNHSEGGGLETARTFVIFFVLLAAGMLAQRWGKKRFISLGQYLIAAGLLMGSLSQNYTMLVISLMLMGVGGGFTEALLNPLVVDIHKEESGRYLNLSHAFYPVGLMLSALLFGELLTLGYSWRFIFQVAAFGSLIIAVLFTVLRFPTAEKDDSSYPKLFATILAMRGFWLFAIALFIGGSIEAAFTFWSRSYVEAYLSDIPRAGAIGVMIFAAAMAVSRFLSAYLASKISLNTILLASSVLGLAVSALIPFATSLTWFYVLLALAGFATASYWPTILAEADAYLPVNTTILFILMACVGIIGFGITPWGLGIIGDSAGLKTGFAIIPLLFIILIAILIFERHLVSKKEKSNPL